MSSASPVSIRQIRGRMARSILLIFLPISLIPLLIIGSIFYAFSRQQLAEQLRSAQPAAMSESASQAGSALLEILPANFRLVGALLFVLVLLVVGLEIWLAARYLTRPLNELVHTAARFVEGDWDQRAAVEKPNEIGLLARMFNQMAVQLSESSRSPTFSESEQREGKRQAISQLSQLAAQGTSLDDFLARALEMIVRYFGCSFAGVYLLEQAGPLGPNLAMLRHAISSPEFAETALASRFEEKAVDIDARSTTDWLVRKAIDTLRAQVSQSPEEPSLLEAAVPLVRGEQVLGVFDLFAASRTSENPMGPFSGRALPDLQAVANIVSLEVSGAAQKDRESSALPPADPTQEIAAREASLIYQSSHSIASAETAEQALDGVAQVLQGSVYASSIFMPGDASQPEALRLVYRNSPLDSYKKARITSLEDADRSSTTEAEPVISVEAIAPYLIIPGKLAPRPVIATDLDTSPLPGELLEASRQMGCDSAAFIPVLRGGQVAALLVLGRSSTARPSPAFTLLNLSPYVNLLDTLIMTQEKIRTNQGAQRRLAELQTIWNISQTISGETNLDALFRVLHKQVETVMGEIGSFGVALYDSSKDTIRIPYLVEAGKQIQVPPFPLGEGLTSIVVRTRTPLLLVEDTEAKALALGARLVGQPARSWLGVPLLFGGEVIGVIIVQDLDHENRFTEDDQHLLSTLAAQVAVVVRNAWLLETTLSRAQQERLLNEITAKIRRSIDIHDILKTTADELGAALGARSAHIEITRPGLLEPSPPDIPAQPEPLPVDSPEEATE